MHVTVNRAHARYLHTYMIMISTQDWHYEHATYLALVDSLKILMRAMRCQYKLWLLLAGLVINLPLNAAQYAKSNTTDKASLNVNWAEFLGRSDLHWQWRALQGGNDNNETQYAPTGWWEMAMTGTLPLESQTGFGKRLTHSIGNGMMGAMVMAKNITAPSSMITMSVSSPVLDATQVMLEHCGSNWGARTSLTIACPTQHTPQVHMF